jgi:hypothetical protein
VVDTSHLSGEVCCFSIVATLLSYLQRCATGAVIDEARCIAKFALDERIAAPELVDSGNGDDQLLARMSARDALCYIWMQLHTEEQREVVRYSYILGM